MKRCLFMLGLLLMMQASFALSWDDLWYNNNQQAIRAYRTKNHAVAAQKFASQKNAEGHYNRGNALAQQKKLKEAISAYDEALQLRPDMEDAKFNRDLLEKMLKQQQQQQQKQQSKNHKNDQQQKGASQQNSSQGHDQNKSQQGHQEQKKPQDAKKDQASQSQDQQQQKNQEQAQQQQHQQQPQSDQSSAQQRQASEQTSPSHQEEMSAKDREQQQNQKQLLRRIPDDPGGLLRRKFLRDYQRRQMGESQW